MPPSRRINRLPRAGPDPAVKIQVNGQPHETRAETVAALLVELGLLPSQVAVEHNTTVLFRHELDQTRLREADCLEIVRVVAGG